MFRLFVLIGLVLVIVVAQQTITSNNNVFLLDASPRIIGGSDAPRGRYRFVASMQDGSHKCGGTLIAPDIVMTAAHCAGSFFEVDLGRYTLSQQGNVEIYLVQEVTTHPRYFRNQNFDFDSYDFALVKLYGESVLPLPQINRDSNLPANAGDDLLILGWGVTSKSGNQVSNILKQATIEYIPNDECSQLTGRAQGQNDASMAPFVINVTLCALGNNSQDTCSGDSGGPILIPGNNIAEDVIVGLTSAGIAGCADKVFPGIYARTSEALDWIDETVCRLSSNPPASFGCPDIPRLPDTSSGGEIVDIVVQIGTDFFPEHIGWMIQSTNAYGVNVTYAIRPILSYSGFTTAANITETIRLPTNRDYTFILLDRWGDGFCCDMGSLKVYDAGNSANSKVYVDASGEKLFSFMALRFDFTLGVASSASPTSTPAPSSTFMPSSTPTISRPFLTVAIVFDGAAVETGWYLELLNDGEQGRVLYERFPGFYEKYKAGAEVQEQVDLLLPGPTPTKYRFVMTDNENNGLCCLKGIGVARVYAGNPQQGNMLAEFSNFYLESDYIFSDTDILLNISGSTVSKPIVSPASPSSAATKYVTSIGTVMLCLLFMASRI